MESIDRLSAEQLAERLASLQTTLQDESDEVQQLVHNLRVHQIELEMQNRELREAHDELEASRDRYADLYDFAPVGYLSFNARGQVLNLNLTAAELLGQERRRVIGQAFVSYLAPGQSTAFVTHLQAVCDSGQGHVLEFTLKGRRGEPIDVHLESVAAAHSPDAECVCRSALTDVSQLTRSRTALRESEARYRREAAELAAIYRSAPVGIAVLDQDLRYLRVNECLADMTGLSVAEHVGKRLAEVVPALAKQAAPGLRRVLATGKPLLGVELSSETPAQPGVRRHWVEHWSPMTDESGRAVGVIAVSEEVTERKLLEATRRREKELRRQNDKLQQFASLVAHDLKAPLRAVDVLSSAIEEDEGARLSSEGLGQLQLLRTRVQRMNELVSGLLDYARAGRADSDVVDVDTALLVQEVLQSRDVPEGFRVSVAPDMPCLRTERAPLQQVFANLIDNAIKYHDRPDGHVRVSSSDIGDFHEFAVADDGPGIAPEDQERIFEMFQRISDKSGVQGTGIGLAVVKKTIETEGGSLHLESAPGRGATFRFTWPKDVVQRRISDQGNCDSH
ncbi:PAS domain-containing sensor histidine kinase [Thiohalomonas denitrificans]|uniref:histidine kinase n=1 Tax=Thiohalomonas denitrificans TaxID=415747 RepID=A0A1G5Q760_9GAMM|nr:ATP-binding protein [Thiohalomonas denitrificans]SCZ57458.1 PAS domain S-box-containing protein [Thiohalomonas denitrificans]